MNDSIKHALLCGACFLAGLFARFAFDFFNNEDEEESIEWNGGLYYGDTNKDGLPDGEGRFEKDGIIFTGSWSSGQIVSGKIESDRYVYEGELSDFKFNGFGVCRYKDGHTYWGYWKDDYKHGVGRLMSESGKQSFGLYDEGNLMEPDNHNYDVGDVVYGIDVSWHQGAVSWQDLYFSAKSNGRITGTFDSASPFMQPPLFVYIKATEGTTVADPMYESNYAEAKRCGFHTGSYHFLSMQSSGKQQAEYFIQNAMLETGDLPPVLDLEKVETTTLVSDEEFSKIIPIAKEWLQTIEEKLGVKPVIYVNVNVYEKFVKGDAILNAHDLWIACPGNKKPEIPNCIIWQFNQHGTMNGVTENYVDVNMYSYDYAHLAQYIKEHGIK